MDAIERIKDQRVIGVGWLAARLWLGYKFVDAAREKVTGDSRDAWIGDHAGAGVTGFLKHSLDLAPGGKLAGDHPAVAGWYAGLIRHVFLPHATAFSYLVAFGELLVGIALILGLLTRFSAAMGVLMNFAFLFAGSAGDNVPMVLLGMPTLLVGAAAGYYGLDHVLMPILRGEVTVVRRRLATRRPVVIGPAAGTR